MYTVMDRWKAEYEQRGKKVAEPLISADDI